MFIEWNMLIFLWKCNCSSSNGDKNSNRREDFEPPRLKGLGGGGEREFKLMLFNSWFQEETLIPILICFWWNLQSSFEISFLDFKKLWFHSFSQKKLKLVLFV
jgi:hypothetical protein